ncbi:uromodulin-like [Montipora capricornis]|uniref:uromodulin-like n=1 Tax=Montipora capricornis TaxID=246305 RepID=UPI0035F20E38
MNLTLLFLLSAVVFFHHTVAIEYSPLGCFKDKRPAKERALRILVKNFRGNLDWNNLNKTVEDCANEAKKKGFLYFGVQFYGECWSDPMAHLTYDKYGPSKQCSHGVGGPDMNFVYMLHGEENECSNYNLLNESDRSEKYQSTGAYKCDHWVHHFKPNLWNRFEGAAGETMAVTPVPPNKCSAFLSGWMDGKHPEVIDGIQSRRVCFTSKRSNCDRSTNIRVRNCGKFYVYYLPNTPGCVLRYCGSGVKQSSLTSAGVTI